MADKIRWEGDLVGNLRDFDKRVERAMVGGAGYASTRIQGYMRTNAKWTDRTGNARSGLKTKVVTGHNKVAIVLYHSVPYGIWLEVRFGGKYAIIQDSIQYGAPLFIEAVGKLIEEG